MSDGEANSTESGDALGRAIEEGDDAKVETLLAEGVDLDNNGVDDGLEIEALLPPAHKNKNTSSFLGADRDSAKFISFSENSGTHPPNSSSIP